MTEKVLDTLTNNKLLAGLLVLALSLALMGMKQAAANDERVSNVMAAQTALAGRLSEESRAMAEVRMAVARLEERQKQDADQITALRQDVKELLRRVR